MVAMACGANVLEIADGMSAAPLPFVDVYFAIVKAQWRDLL